jgi:hypothetical protein
MVRCVGISHLRTMHVIVRHIKTKVCNGKACKEGNTLNVMTFKENVCLGRHVRARHHREMNLRTINIRPLYVRVTHIMIINIVVRHAMVMQVTYVSIRHVMASRG